MSSKRQIFQTASTISVFVLLFTLYSLTEGKVYEKCPLARIMDKQKISSRSLISNWVCLAMAESGGDTGKVTTLDNESTNYGIFQINSKTWCREGRKGGRCNKKCEDFLTDDLTDDIECAKQIYNDGGFETVSPQWKKMATKQISWTIVGVVLIVLPAVINAKIYTKCELARQLTANGISRTYQGHWVCLAIAVSGLDTEKTTTLPNLSANYGIFQINSKEWCRVGYKGGKCNMKCEDLVTDNITNAIKCSKIIQQQNGFNEWVMWQKKCKGKDLPDIANCAAIG
uniref:lysozyme n=1 Tax=Anopheles minimus TaxID=112268 RepID=A0A182WJD4_9DIPT